MSFIKKEESESSSMWDWIILAAIVVGGGSFWFYYNYQKNATLNGFLEADSLFHAGQYEQSLEIYNNLRSSDYLESGHDSLLTDRLDTLYELLD